MFQRGREVTSWNSGGEAAAQRKWAYGCACWSCVWPWRGGGGLLPEVAVACGGGLLPEEPTQHPARWNLTLQEPEQSAGGSEGFRMYTHI